MRQYDRVHLDVGCPEYGYEGDYFNIGKTNWCFCPTHRLKWCIGENMISSWRDEPKPIGGAIGKCWPFAGRLSPS